MVSASRIYVGAVMGARGLAFVRLVVIAWVLGEAGQREFGAYQQGLELINWIVPLAMLGLADVAERYGAMMAARGELRANVMKHVGRLAGVGCGIGAVLVASGPWVARGVWGVEGSVKMVVACAATAVGLALYQYVMALLRGLGRYGRVAAIEIAGAVAMLGFSAAAAWTGSGTMLVWGYGLSVALMFPVGLMSALGTTMQAGPVREDAEVKRGFAAWALLRLLLTMTFGFMAVWGVRHLGDLQTEFWEGRMRMVPTGLEQVADFAFSFRIAQLVGFLAVTGWSAGYGVAAGYWTHGRRNRARLKLLRMGMMVGVLLVGMAWVISMMRGWVAMFAPEGYRETVTTLLPAMLGMFLWYGFLALWAMYGDLHEKPARGAALWGIAVAVQVGGLFFGGAGDPRAVATWASCAGLGAAVLVAGPLLVWRPWRLTKPGVAMGMVAICPAAFMAPVWVVDVVVTVTLGLVAVMLGSLGMMRRGWLGEKKRRGVVGRE